MDSSSSTECACRICAARGAPFGADEQRVVDAVLGTGWMITSVEPTADMPGWSFTTGFTHTFGMPDVVITEMDPSVSRTALDDVGAHAAAGLRWTQEARRRVLLRDRPWVMSPVHHAWHLPLFGWSQWFANAGRLEVVQLAPTQAQHVDLATATEQLRSGPWFAWAADSAWPGRGQADGLVYADRTVLDGGAVLGVSVDDDGDWCFMSREPDDDTDVGMTEVFHLVLRDPTLAALATLPAPREAWRTEVGAPWEQRPLRQT